MSCTPCDMIKHSEAIEICVDRNNFYSEKEWRLYTQQFRQWVVSCGQTGWQAFFGSHSFLGQSIMYYYT